MLCAIAVTAGLVIIKPKSLGTYYENQLKNAEQILSTAQSKGNKEGEALAYANIGFIYFKGGDYNKAIINLNRALKIKPKDHVVLYWIGMSYFEKDDLKEAEKHLLRAAENATRLKKGLPLYDLGRLYEKQNKYDKAIEAYEKSINDNTKMWNPHANLAKLYEKKGNNALALKEYENAYQYNSEDKALKKAIDRLKEKVAK